MRENLERETETKPESNRDAVCVCVRERYIYRERERLETPDNQTRFSLWFLYPETTPFDRSLSFSVRGQKFLRLLRKKVPFPVGLVGLFRTMEQYGWAGDGSQSDPSPEWTGSGGKTGLEGECAYLCIRFKFLIL